MELTNTIHNNPQYANWLSNLKDKVRNARIKAAISVNRELLLFYWELGADIVQKQAQSNWGDGFLNQLSKDLMTEFPDMKGFSPRNLKYIKQWHLFYTQSDLSAQIGQQAVAQLKQPDALITRIPWGHNITIISKCKSREEALYYVHNTLTRPPQ